MTHIVTDKQFLAGADAETKSPFGGVIGMLEGMIADGTVDRFNDMADRRAQNNKQVLTVYLDGTFKIQGEGDAHYAAVSEPDFAANIDLIVLKDAIKKASN